MLKIAVAATVLLVLSFPALALQAAEPPTGSGRDAQHGKSLQPYASLPRRQAVSEQPFGFEVDDPYRWMESAGHADEVKQWLQAAGEHTQRQLGGLPARVRLRDALKVAAATTSSVRDVVEVGERLFHLRREPGADQWTLLVRERGVDRVLVDPVRFGGEEGTRAAIHHYSVSPDGRRVAFHIGRDGSETGTVHFMDVASGELLPDSIAPVWGEFAVSWIDGDSVFATRMTDAVPGDRLQGMQVVRVDLGGNTSPPLLGYQAPDAPGFEAREFPQVEVVEGSKWQLATGSGARPESRLLVRHRERDAAWQAIAGYDAHLVSMALQGDDLWLVSRADAPNGRLLRLRLTDGVKLAQAEVQLKESDDVLSHVRATADGIYVVAMRDGVDSILYRPADGDDFRAVPLPFAGMIGDIEGRPGNERLILSIEGHLQPPRHYALDGAAIATLDLEKEREAAASRYAVVHEEATSADGTRIPMTLIVRKGQQPSAQTPAILYAYGSYGISLRPRYRPLMFPWIDQGGIWVDCHARGGGEKGRRWHEAGRGPNKPNGQADYIACAERLVERAFTSAARLGGFAGSMGGVLVGPATLARPDLFDFVVLAVAELNPTRLLQSQNGMNQVAEIGDPRTAEGFAALYRMDSYLALSRAREYPDMLVTIGINDQRVSPWQSAKFAARYLQRAGGDSLLLVRTDSNAGHAAGLGRDQVAELYADIYAFALDRVSRSGKVAPSMGD